MLDLYIIWDDPFGKKVIRHLEKNPEKLKGIVGIDKVPSNVQVSSPAFIDEADEKLPENLPDSCDVILVLGIDMYIQSLPKIVEKTKAEAVIVPIEDSDWYPLGILNQIREELEKKGVEGAYPRPFCSLQGKGRKIVEQFITDYEIGKPALEIKVKNKEINNPIVNISAPCGSTLTVADRIKGTSVSFESSNILELEGRISKAHHSHPCTGDMMKDPVLGETILHRAGYLVRDAVKKAIGLDLELSEKEKKYGKIAIECPELCRECVEICKRSGTGILEIEGDEVVVPNYEKCNGCRSCVKKCPIDVAGKIVTKRDSLLLDKWEDEKLAN